MVITTATIGTGIGSVIARRLASGGESLRLSSADIESAQRLAGEIGPGAVVAVDNSDALQGVDAVVLAVRFAVLKSVIDEIAEACSVTDRGSCPNNPVGLEQTECRAFPAGRPIPGEAVAGWLPEGARLALASAPCRPIYSKSSSNRSPEPAVLFYVTDDDRLARMSRRLIRTAGFEPIKVGGIEQSGPAQRSAATFTTSSSAPQKRTP